MIAGIASEQKRVEILDWYHLKENLYKLGGSKQRLRKVETSLWHGQIDRAISSFADGKIPQVNNFLAYLERQSSKRG
ncbi:hypothetical protein QUA79_10655 [Microcoleus sp. F8-D1]